MLFYCIWVLHNIIPHRTAVNISLSLWVYHCLKLYGVQNTIHECMCMYALHLFNFYAPMASVSEYVRVRVCIFRHGVSKLSLLFILLFVRMFVSWLARSLPQSLACIYVHTNTNTYLVRIYCLYFMCISISLPFILQRLFTLIHKYFIFWRKR